MAIVKLRFYGRFAYARPRAGGGPISVLAPNFDNSALRGHRPLMTVRRDRVVFLDKDTRLPLTTLPPAFRVVSDAADILTAENLVWDLSTLTGGFPLTGDVSLEDSEEGVLPNLLDFAGTGATLDASALRVTAAGKTKALIRVTKGAGIAAPALDRKVNLITRGDAISKPYSPLKQQGTGDDIVINPSDLVEFTIELPAGSKFLTFTFDRPDSAQAGLVTVAADTTVAVSNLCTGIRALTEPDFEFDRYYNLLTADPGNNALLPLELLTLAAEGGDCDIQCVVPF